MSAHSVVAFVSLVSSLWFCAVVVGRVAHGQSLGPLLLSLMTGSVATFCAAQGWLS